MKTRNNRNTVDLTMARRHKGKYKACINKVSSVIVLLFMKSWEGWAFFLSLFVYFNVLISIIIGELSRGIFPNIC